MNNDPEKIIKIQLKKYSPEEMFKDTGRAKPLVTYYEKIYKSEVPKYKQFERVDSIRNTRKRWGN